MYFFYAYFMIRLNSLLSYIFFFLMIRRPPRSTRTDTLFPYTTLFRSAEHEANRFASAFLMPRGSVLAFAPMMPTLETLIRLKHHWIVRSEEHTSELQSLMRISYAVFCLKKKNQKNKLKTHQHNNTTTNTQTITNNLKKYQYQAT